MPRIHGGGNTQRGSSRSRKANGSLSDKEQVTVTTNTEDDIIDVDEFDDDEFRYDGVSPRDVQQPLSGARRQRLPPKQQEFMLLEDTSSEEEEGPDRSYKSNKNSSTARKLSATTKKKKSGKVNVDPRPKRLVPTVSSPKITLSSIAKKESTNNNAKQRRKGPIGKPIKTLASNGVSVGGGKKKKSSNNDENYDNDAEASGMKRAVSRSRGKKGGNGIASATASTKQKKNQNNVSFASDSKMKNNDCEHKHDNDAATLTDVSNNNAPINQRGVEVVPARAIAIDNRILPTFMADSTSRQSFFGYLPQFLEGMMEKSVLRSQQQLYGSNNRHDGEGVSIIASLVHGTTSSPTASGGRGNGKNVGVQVQQSVVPRASYLLEDKSGDMTNGERNEWLSEFRTPINHNSENVSVNDDGNAMAGYGAKESWNVFGDLVEAIEDKLSRATMDANSSRTHPYSVTLFTTDGTLFAGTESTSCHIQGLEAFWKRISPAFQNNTISSVTIVIVGTKFDFGSHDFHLSFQYIDGIRKHISEMSQSMDSASEWIFDEWNGKNLVDVQLEYIEGTDISFQCLAQKFVQESLYETYSSHVHGTISFDLPETIDGIQCKILLSLQYATLPYSIDSNETENLVNDMIRISSLSSSNVEVIQSIPLASVDSSLIYGVPMSARAGIDEDVSRYNEMKMLVRQMWKYLSSSGIGLVLRVTCEDATDESDKSPYGNDELFLLVCEEALEKPRLSSSDSQYDRSEALGVELATKPNPSCQGMLFRYASKHQMLRFVNEGETEEAEKEEEETAEELQYQDYIERSIEMLASTGLNPLLL